DVPSRLNDRLRVVAAVVLQVEEVHARAGAVEQHLGEREGGAEIDAVAVEPRRVRVEHAVAPRHEVEVVTEPAEQRLEGVTVGVDGAGEERLPGEPHEVGGERGVAPRGRERPDVDDATVLDGHRQVRHEAAIDEHQVRDEAHRSSSFAPRYAPPITLKPHDRAAMPSATSCVASTNSASMFSSRHTMAVARWIASSEPSSVGNG